MKRTSSDDQRPPKEIIKEWWPQAYDEFEANPEANSLAIWVVACLLYPANDTSKIIEKAEELLYLCQNYRIPCEGNPFNSYQYVTLNLVFPEIKGKQYISGLFAKLSKETVSKHLQDYREWPLAAEVPLSKWWEKQPSEQLPIRMTVCSSATERSFGNVNQKKRDRVKAEIHSDDSPEALLIRFVHQVLINYPHAKTADLRRYCFENMENLNARDGKIINDLLIKAGAIKSRKGEHAKYIEWKSKYPKAQWVRIFNKKK
ncbi:hypothetical protein [Candidatus Methylobacter favarea]|nr:hypothetical protein [Candidatus Methylobacter favarea]